MIKRSTNSLVIVESPTKCKTIAGYLKSEDSNYTVIASYGHIRSLPRKSGSVLPNQDFKMIWEQNALSAKHIQNIIHHARNTDATNGTILLATDDDREGAAIAWHIMEILRENKINAPIKRIVFQEITKKSIQNAISSATDLDRRKVDSYFARLSLDYLVGFNISPVLWTKIKGCKSAGRVQSSTLRAIVDRELEIIKFKSEKYWTLAANFDVDKHQYIADLYEWKGKSLEKFMWTKESVEDAKACLEQNKYKILEIESKKQSRSPNPPFTTSTMQQEASRRFGWRPSRTLKVAQKLYEGVQIESTVIGLITYMRTDSVRITDEALVDCATSIKNLYGDEYLKTRVYKSKSDNVQDAHEAVRPTEFKKTPASVASFLEDDMQKLYDLIWRRSVASQMSDAEYAITNIILGGKDGKWKIHGRQKKFDGFLKIMSDENETDQLIRPMTKDAAPECLDISVVEHATQPPARFTESGLIKHLDEVGIGRPSTYASILDTLENRDYIGRQNKKIVPTVKGWIVTGFLSESCPEYIRDDFTAEVEGDLDKISQGEIAWKSLLSNFWTKFSQTIDDMRAVDSRSIVSKIADRYADYFFGTTEELRKCPQCASGNKVLCVIRDGEFLGCSNHPDCDWKQSFNQTELTSIGTDPNTNEEIFLKQGPYGHYLNWGQSKKNVTVPDKIAGTINLDMAVKLGRLPLLLGQHPFTDKEITLNIGRYGPYLLYNSVYVSCKIENIFDMTLTRAVDLLGASKKLKAKLSDPKLSDPKSSGKKLVEPGQVYDL